MSKKPTHGVYALRKFQRGGEEQATRVYAGVAWHDASNDAIDIVLQALPLSLLTDGRLYLRRKLTAEELDTTRDDEDDQD